MPLPVEITLPVLTVAGNSNRKNPQFWLVKKPQEKTQLRFAIDMFDLHEPIVAGFFFLTIYYW